MWDTGDSVRDFWDTVWDSWVSRLDNTGREAEGPPSEKSIGFGRSCLWEEVGSWDVDSILAYSGQNLPKYKLLTF